MPNPTPEPPETCPECGAAAIRLTVDSGRYECDSDYVLTCGEWIQISVGLLCKARRCDQLVAQLAVAQSALAAKRKDCDRLADALAEIGEHERQSHETLAAILGSDTSLLDGARRMQSALTASQAENAKLWEVLQAVNDVMPNLAGFMFEEEENELGQHSTSIVEMVEAALAAPEPEGEET